MVGLPRPPEVRIEIPAATSPLPLEGETPDEDANGYYREDY
jgi:hypothetical protein